MLVSKNKYDKLLVEYNTLKQSYEELKKKYNVAVDESPEMFARRMKHTLKEFGIKSNISAKTLLNTIAYDRASVKRILRFIQSEWRMDFSIFLDMKKLGNFTDTFESLWG